jgi:uncharacterized protein (DUF2132 family)
VTLMDEVREADGHLVRELHGINLKQILEYLVHHLGFERLAGEIPVNCFINNPSIQSSLIFLRRTPWARTKVEQLYVDLRTEDLVAQRATETLSDSKQE